MLKDKFHNNSKPLQDTDPDFMDYVLSTRQSSPIEDGVIIKVHPTTYTVDVETDNGTFSECRIMTQRLSSNGSGDSGLPPIGTQCLLCTSGAIPTVMGFITSPVTGLGGGQELPNQPPLLSGGVSYTDPTYASQSGANFSGGRDTTLISGDYAITSPAGNSIAALNGVSLLKGSDGAQVLATAIDNLVRIVSGHFQHYHAAGVTEIERSGDEVNYHVTIGKTVKNDGAAILPIATLSVGHDKNGLELIIHDEDGSPITTVTIDKEGETSITTSTLQLSAERVFVDTDSEVTLNISGNLAATVDNNTDIVTKSLSVESLAGASVRTASNLSLSSGNDTSFTTSGKRYDAVFKEFNGIYEGKRDITDTSGKFSQLFGPSGSFGKFTMNLGDLAITSLKNAVLGGEISTDILGSRINIGGTLPRYAVIRTWDLPALCEDIVSYINATNTFTPTPIPKVVVPPGISAVVGAKLTSYGSKIVFSS